MATGIGPLECPFCSSRFLTSASLNTRKLRKCPHCKGQFFYFRGTFYIAVRDIRKMASKAVTERNQIYKMRK